jgi:hypothetical protein
VGPSFRPSSCCSSGPKSGTIKPAHVRSGRSQGCPATAQAAYSWLTLHPCVAQDQIQKKFCVGVDFTLLLSAIWP